MNSFLRSKKRLTCLALLGISLGIFAYIAGFDFQIVPKASLAKAYDQWKAKGSDHYQVQISLLLPPAYFGTYQATVQGDQVVADNSPFPDQLSKYTVNQMFERVHATLMPLPDISIAFCPYRYTVEFDADLGYITTFIARCPSGLLCPAMGECTGGVKFSNLKLLPQ